MTALDRRRFLAAGAALAAPGIMSARAAEAIDAANALVTGRLTIDMHSHGGGFIREDTTADPVVDAMRAGGLAVACLAIVSDSPTHKVFADRTIHPVREPDPGELYAWSRASFARVLRLAQGQGAKVVGSAADLRAAAAGGPAVVVAAEGADFLEGRIDRVEEARRQFGLRHLQLVHYRPNELGDIQTENPVHNGLTDFGVEVVRACNRLGIVVDVAHATYEVVKRAAAATSRPLILSHTSLTAAPGRIAAKFPPTMPASSRKPAVSSACGRPPRSIPISTRWRLGWRTLPRSSESTMSDWAATCAGSPARRCCRATVLFPCSRKRSWRAASRRRMPAKSSAATTPACLPRPSAEPAAL